LLAAKIVLLVRTCAYFPRTSLTTLCRRDGDELGVRGCTVIVLIIEI